MATAAVKAKVGKADAFPASRKGRKSEMSAEAKAAFDLVTAGGVATVTGDDRDKVYRQVRALASDAGFQVQSATDGETLYMKRKASK